MENNDIKKQNQKQYEQQRGARHCDEGSHAPAGCSAVNARVREAIKINKKMKIRTLLLIFF